MIEEEEVNRHNLRTDEVKRIMNEKLRSIKEKKGDNFVYECLV